MKNLLIKEFKLATFPITWFFLAFSLMTFLPGYPILMSSFFICMGIFQSVQLSRDSEDITYSALLPIRKKDVVTAKFLSAATIETLGFLLCAVFTSVRMIFLKDAAAYTANKLMTANISYLAFVLIIFSMFNLVFLGGFFKTAYYYGKPFIFFIIVSMLVIIAAEIICHVPALKWVGNTVPDLSQIILLVVSIFMYIGITYIALKKSQKSFETIDL